MSEIYFSKLADQEGDKLVKFKRKGTLEAVYDKGIDYKHPSWRTLMDAGLV